MSSTVVQICNSAIAKIGANPILTLQDDSQEARLCLTLYDIVRRKLLRSHPWRFAIKRLELGKVVDAPVFEYESAFQIPQDCLRVLDVDQPDLPWKQEGQFIVNNQATCKIKYIFDMQDASSFDVNFAEVLAYLLAMEICFPLTQSTTRVADLKQSMNDELKVARSYSAQVGSVERVEADDWLRVRY